MRKFIIISLPVLIFFASANAAYRDYTFRSALFGENRTFRVYTGTGFDNSGTTRYPVIYYLHGCLGSYQGDQYTDYPVAPPYCSTGCGTPYSKPFNADFQAFVNNHRVIVVMADGNVGAGGCNVWYPYSLASSWTRNEYNFSLHLREIFRKIDSLYPTTADPQHRAVSGLSMGGHSTLFTSSQNSHLIRSFSTFCHAPVYYKVAGPDYTTRVDVTQLWRNYRGLSTRTTSVHGDYIYHHSRDLSEGLRGAGLNHEYHQADFDRHWAADIDSQFLFHMRTFNEPRTNPACFSFVTPYPNSDPWGWTLASAKDDTGFIYLKDACRTGFMLCSRKWLPYGAAMTPFAVTVTTAPLYTPSAAYTLTRYDYRTGAFLTAPVQAGTDGRLAVSATGGMGQEFGVSGNGLPAALVLLADTSCEDWILNTGEEKIIGGTVVNLSGTTVSGASVELRTTSPLLSVLKSSAALPALPARSAVRLDTIFRVSGKAVLDTAESQLQRYALQHQQGFVNIRFRGAGVDTLREQKIRFMTAESIPWLDSADVAVLDGRTDASLYAFSQSTWGTPSNPYPTNEGRGDADRKIDSGEVFSLWIRMGRALSPSDSGTWHPVRVVSQFPSPAVRFVGNNLYNWDRCRDLQSNQLTLTRVPTVASPVELTLMTEVLDYYPRGTRGQEKVAYRFFRLNLPLSLAIGAERTPWAAPVGAVLAVSPNPFHAGLRIEFSLPVPAASEAGLFIFDMAGRRVFSARASELKTENGRHVLDWNASGPAEFPAGVYTVRIMAGGRLLSAKAVFLK